MSGYRVDPAGLQQCDVSLADAVASSRAALSQVRAAAAELLDTRWQGAAASAFRLGWEQWVDGVTVMLDALEAMAGLIGGSGAGYAATEAAVRASVAAAG